MFVLTKKIFTLNVSVASDDGDLTVDELYSNCSEHGSGMLGQPMRNSKMNSSDRKMDSTDDRELIFGLECW